MPIRSDILTQLASTLAELYPDQASARAMARSAGLNLTQVAFDPKASNTWDSILDEAEKQGRTQALLARAQSQYPVHTGLDSASRAYAGWVTAGRPQERNTVSSIQGNSQSQPNTIISRGLIPTWLLLTLIFLCVVLAVAGGMYLNQRNRDAKSTQATAMARAAIVPAKADSATATAQTATAMADASSREAATAIAATATWEPGDDDRDGLSNEQELNLGTLPSDRDTDADGLKDGVEVNERKTDPLVDDTDGDGWKDGLEVERGTNPLKEDTDGDGLPDPTDPDPLRGPTSTFTTAPTWTPTLRPTDTPVPPTTTPTPTPRPELEIRVWADNTNLTLGQCTLIHWDMRYVSYVYLDNAGQGGQGSRNVCPATTTTYTWRIGLPNGAEEIRTVTVAVENAPNTNAGWFIVNKLSGKCLDVRGKPGINNEAVLQLYDCEYADPSTDQRWRLTQEGFIQNTLSDKCIDVNAPSGVDNELSLQLYDCEYGNSSTDQRWRLTQGGFIQSTLSGKCIDVNAPSGVDNELPLQLYDCEYGNPYTDQRWEFR